MQRQVYKYYDLVMALFVTILLCSNIIGAAKVATVWGFTFGAGVLFFPISYIRSVRLCTSPEGGLGRFRSDHFCVVHELGCGVAAARARLERSRGV